MPSLREVGKLCWSIARKLQVIYFNDHFSAKPHKQKNVNQYLTKTSRAMNVHDNISHL